MKCVLPYVFMGDSVILSPLCKCSFVPCSVGLVVTVLVCACLEITFLHPFLKITLRRITIMVGMCSVQALKHLASCFPSSCGRSGVILMGLPLYVSYQHTPQVRDFNFNVSLLYIFDILTMIVYCEVILWLALWNSKCFLCWMFVSLSKFEIVSIVILFN